MYYLKLNFRRLFRNKLTTFALVFSLMIGFTAFITVSSYVLYENSYDTHFPDNENIYRIVRETYSNDVLKLEHPTCERKLGESLVNKYPNVHASGFLFRPNNPNFKIGENVFSNSNVFHASKGLIDVLSLKIIQKKSKTLLDEPYKVIISESTAKKYFGNQNPLGKKVFKYPAFNYEVEGVYEDIHKNTHFSADMFLSFHDNMHLPPPVKADWGEAAFYTYISVDNNTILPEFEGKINELVYRHKKGYFEKSNIVNRYHLQPLTDIHLESNLQGEITQNANGDYLNILLAVSLLLLIASVFNYVYFTYSRLLSNMKDIGIQKVLGSKLKQFYQKYLSESFILHTLALILAVFICSLIKEPIFQSLGINVRLSLSNSGFWLILITVYLLSILITSILPVLYVKKKNSLDLIHFKRYATTRKISFQHIITVGQFAIVVLIIASIIGIDKQLNYLLNKDKGLDISNKLIVRVPQNISKNSKRVNNLGAFEQELIKHAGIKNISNTSAVPGDLPAFSFTIKEKGQPAQVSAGVFITDKSFIEMYDLELQAGSNFSDKNEGNRECIINEKCLVQLGYKNPEEAIGRIVNFESSRQDFQAAIRGVTGDFNFRSMKQQPTPMVLLDWTESMLWGYYAIELSHTKDKGFVTNFVAEIFKNTFPNYPFEYFWLEDHYNNQYEAEFKLTALLKYFVFFIILVSVINLLSMVWYTTIIRTKEIGIRKVNGATASSIFKMLNFDYLKWITLASFIALPIAYYSLSKWLEGFTYQTDISWWIFTFSAIFVLMIGLLTTSWQTMKIANMNPIDSLRDE
ncbi:MAG: FtsX-like permease family protein [Bacteroidales bacterium]